MRPRFASLALAALAALSASSLACTDGVLEADALDDEAALDDPLDDRLLELVPAPDHLEPSAPPIPLPLRPLPPPELDDNDEVEWEPIGYGAPDGPPRLVISEHGYAGPCSFGVVERGLPAIDREAERVVNLEFEGAQGPSDWDTSVVALVWRDFDDNVVAREQVYDSEALAPGDPYDAPRVYCARARKRIEQRLPALNAALDAAPLVPMISQPVQLDALYANTPPLSPRASERPVELRYNSGQLIARVRGVDVLARVSHPDWQGEHGMLDAYNPNIIGLYADRETGVAVVERSYESASCMSDTQTYAGVTRLPEAVLTEIERRQHLALRDPNTYY